MDLTVRQDVFVHAEFRELQKVLILAAGTTLGLKPSQASLVEL
jgi:hypothetical protein